MPGTLCQARRRFRKLTKLTCLLVTAEVTAVN